MLLFIPKYAAEWKNFGSSLGLKTYDLDCIAKDNAHDPYWSSACMRTVFVRWLQQYHSPTWGKVEDAINYLKMTARGDFLRRVTGI